MEGKKKGLKIPQFQFEFTLDPTALWKKLVVPTFEESEEYKYIYTNIYTRSVFLFRPILEKLTAYGHIDPEIFELPSDHSCTRLRCVFAGWNNTCIFCFQTQIIYAWQTVRTHNRCLLNWRKLIGLIHTINDSNFNPDNISLNIVACQCFIYQKLFETS